MQLAVKEYMQEVQAYTTEAEHITGGYCPLKSTIRK